MRSLLSLSFSFKKRMGLPCLPPVSAAEKELFHASEPAAPAQPVPAAPRPSRFQKGNDSLVFPLGKTVLIHSKLLLKQEAYGPVRLLFMTNVF